MRPPVHYDAKGRATMLRMLLNDEPGKAVAIEVGVSEPVVYRFAARNGLRRMYVTAEERAEILERRRKPS